MSAHSKILLMETCRTFNNGALLGVVLEHAKNKMCQEVEIVNVAISSLC